MIRPSNKKNFKWRVEKSAPTVFCVLTFGRRMEWSRRGAAGAKMTSARAGVISNLMTAIIRSLSAARTLTHSNSKTLSCSLFTTPLFAARIFTLTKKRVALAPNQSKLSRRRRLISDIWYDTARGAQEALVLLDNFQLLSMYLLLGIFQQFPH